MALTKVTSGMVDPDPTNASNLSSGSVPTAQLGNVDTTSLETDIALLGFKVAANGSLAAYNLQDQTIDDFQDSSGIDASASTNEIRDTTGKYVSGSQAGNYFGNGELGTVTFGASGITQSGQSVNIDDKLSTGSASGGPGNSSYGGCGNDSSRNRLVLPPNPSACYEATVTSGTASITSNSGSTDGSSINADGDMVLLEFDTLTIDASTTLTTNHPCRGLFIYVKNNCTINGSISMNSRGAWADPTSAGGSDSAVVNASGLQLPMIVSGGSQTLSSATFAGTGNAVVAAVANQTGISSDGTIFSIARSGAAGGAQSSCQGGHNDGTAGTTGAATISTGGGASGGVSHNNSVSGCPILGGAGAAGTCFGGGSGGGGCHSNNSSTPTAGDAAASNGGTGGDANTVGSAQAGGGCGNPGGDGSQNGGGSTSRMGGDGTGGVIWLVVGGNLTIGSGGSIDVRGQGGDIGEGGGGPSGGGAAMILHSGTLSNSGSINTAKTESYFWPVSGTNDGGAGSSHTAQVDGPAQYLDLTLVSTSNTADSAPTKGDLVMTYTNGAGTATVNTDIKGWISRDNGSTYTQATLSSEGTTGGHTILTAHNVDISSQPSGTSMRYKITTHNQSEAKQTRIQAVSLGWA